jgi:hypothetical protein
LIHKCAVDESLGAASQIAMQVLAQRHVNQIFMRGLKSERRNVELREEILICDYGMRHNRSEEVR